MIKSCTGVDVDEVFKRSELIAAMSVISKYR